MSTKCLSHRPKMLWATFVLVGRLLMECHQRFAHAFVATLHHRDCESPWVGNRGLEAAAGRCTPFCRLGHRDPSSASSKTLRKGFLDGLFGGGSDEPQDRENAVLFQSEIASSPDKVQTQFESLSDFVTNKWIRLFETQEIKLTTPVRVITNLDAGTPDASEGITDQNAGRLLFEAVDTGYTSRKDERQQQEDNDGVPSDNDDQKPTPPGGVEVVVQKLENASSPLRVLARRCDVDEDTLIKEMSEEKIVDELRKALQIWRSTNA